MPCTRCRLTVGVLLPRRDVHGCVHVVRARIYPSRVRLPLLHHCSTLAHTAESLLRQTLLLPNNEWTQLVSHDASALKCCEGAAPGLKYYARAWPWGCALMHAAPCAPLRSQAHGGLYPEVAEGGSGAAAVPAPASSVADSGVLVRLYRGCPPAPLAATDNGSLARDGGPTFSGAARPLAATHA